MPPRLPIPTALRGSTSTRLFSSTPTTLYPPPPSATSLSQLGSSIANKQQTPKKRDAISSSSAHDVVSRLFDRAQRSQVSDAERRSALMDVRDRKREDALAQEYLKQMPRNWQSGDVYAPHDLSAVEMSKYKKRLFRPKVDIVDTLNIRPTDMYKNFTLISEFMTSAGQLRTAAHTRLRQVNHRRIAKMVRRAVGMGLYPSTHAHPELIRSQFYPIQRQEQNRYPPRR